MEHVFITGGSGYIGSILVPMLLEKGYRVTVLDTFEHGFNSLGLSCADPNFTAVKGDCRNEETVKALVIDADWVIPLAAVVGAPACTLDPIAARSINLEAVRTLMGLLSPNQRVVFPVTNSGYGIGEADKFCDETSPLRPISLYGQTKVQAEESVMQRGNAVCFRLATVFGFAPRMRIDLLVNDFTYRAVRDRALIIFQGHFKRNYIHIRDVANGFLHGMTQFDAMKNDVYNMGLSDANLSKLELAARIQNYVPEFFYHEAEIGTDPDKRDYIVSNEKLEKTGWQPQHSLDMGIQELIKGYRMIRNEVYSNV
ncbi:MAG: NAD(P)-dependent oxidoreductase [Pseudomonadota bacterium]